jgi:hypothetical protein
VDRRLRDGLPALTWNPFRDEGAAFQLVFVTIGVCGLVALGSWISTWVGIAVFVALVVAACALVWRRRRRPPVAGHARILLVGDPSAELLTSLRARAEVRLVSDAGGVEDALAGFAADEIVVLDQATAGALCARFLVPVRVAIAGDYLPETASR